MRSWESRRMLVRSAIVVASAIVLGAGLAFVLAPKGQDGGGGDVPATSDVLEKPAKPHENPAARRAATASSDRSRRGSERRDLEVTRPEDARLASAAVRPRRGTDRPRRGADRAPAARPRVSPQGTATPAPRHRSGRRPSAEPDPVTRPRRTPRPRSTPAPAEPPATPAPAPAPAPAQTVAPSPTAGPTPVPTDEHGGEGRGSGQGHGHGGGKPPKDDVDDDVDDVDDD